MDLDDLELAKIRMYSPEDRDTIVEAKDKTVLFVSTDKQYIYTAKWREDDNG